MMLFQLKNLGTDTSAIARAMKAQDAFAQVSVDAATNQVKVLGQLTSAQALAAFKAAGYEASPAGEAREAHVSGGSTCCGSCA